VTVANDKRRTRTGQKPNRLRMGASPRWLDCREA
jgi:hypothetical protein